MNIKKYALGEVAERLQDGWVEEVFEGAHSTSLDALLSEPLPESFRLEEAPKFFSARLPGVLAVLVAVAAQSRSVT